MACVVKVLLKVAWELQVGRMGVRCSAPVTGFIAMTSMLDLGVLGVEVEATSANSAMCRMTGVGRRAPPPRSSFCRLLHPNIGAEV